MRKVLTLATAVAVGGAVATVAAAQETHRVSGDEVAIYNLVGSVQIRSGSGGDVVVRMTRGGQDADRLRIETGEIDGRNALRVLYPSDEIVYPEMGRGSSTTVRVRGDGTFSDNRGDGGDRVRVRGSGSGLEAWADLVIEVPSGRSLELYLAVGEADARGTQGRLSIDTGSGAVGAFDVTGPLLIDTGSGQVTVERVNGDVVVDTGSGGVRVSGVRGDRVLLDTGSGRVSASDIQAAEVLVDTGSGSVDLDAVTADVVSVDTGSGSVDVGLLSDVESLVVDTGSGSVTVRAPADLGARVEIETGSGGIDLDFPVEVRTVRRDRLSGVIGDGRGTIEIDTGSGSIRLVRR